MNEIKLKIENCYQVVRESIGTCSKQVSYYLRMFGKGGDARSVRRQGEIQDVKRRNFYENFLIYLTAIYYANRAGFELLITDLEVFIASLRRTKPQTQVIPFPALVENETLLTSLIKIRNELTICLAGTGLEVR